MSELGPEAREILRNGRNGDDPLPADRARIHAALMATIAASAAITAASAANAAASAELPASVGLSKSLVSSLFGSAFGKGLLILGLGVAGLGSWWAWPQPKSNSIPPVSTITQQPILSLSAPAEPPPMVIPVEVLGDKPAPMAAGGATAVAPEKPLLVEEKPPPSEAVAPPPDSLVVETQRLREAHGAMRDGDPEKALALLSEEAAEAEGQKLREERAAARVLALCKLGRVDEAHAEAAAFLAQNPQSPLADRVRAACPTSH